LSCTTYLVKTAFQAGKTANKARNFTIFSPAIFGLF